MKHKILWNILAALLITVALLFSATVVVLAATLPPESSEESAPKELSSWQSRLKDNIFVTDVIMPGSHDAGTAGMANLMATQSDHLEKQLEFGVRYFDVRPMLSGGKLYPYHLLPNTKYPFEDLLNDVLSFLTANTSEFVILDFQHFEKSEVKTKELLDRLPQIAKLAVPSNVPISSLTVGEMRAKGYQLILIWNEDYMSADRPYLHERGSNLYSPYNENAHKKSDEHLIEHFATYYTDKREGQFFVLQAQRTGMFGGEMVIFKLEESFRPKVNAYIGALEGENLTKTNIIMRDFVTMDIQSMVQIIRLNEKKGNFTI